MNLTLIRYDEATFKHVVVEADVPVEQAKRRVDEDGSLMAVDPTTAKRLSA